MSSFLRQKHDYTLKRTAYYIVSLALLSFSAWQCRLHSATRKTMRYVPNTIDDWLEAASARSTDAHNLYDKRSFVAALYLSGYVVECRLKALIIINGNKPPTWGPKGHELRGLVEKAGFRLSDIGPDRRQFLEHWSTDLRYQASLPSGMDHASFFEAAKGLSGWLAKRIKRPQRRRRRI